MNNKDVFFRLFASCVPVRGINNSLIYDLQRNDVYEIPNEIYDIISIVEENSFDEIEKENKELSKFLKALVEDEIGFFTKEPHRFPKLNTQFETPDIISNAVIEFSDSSQHDINKIFTSLNKLFCKNILLLFYNKPSNESLFKILNIATNNNIDYIELWFTEKIKTNKITKHFKNVRKIVFLHSKKEVVFTEKQCTIKYKSFKSFEDLCKQIPQKFNLSQLSYNEALKYNTCLNKKLSIDKNRKIKNCPFLEADFGDYKNTNIFDTVNSERFQKLWHLNKDKINECKDCQYRYMCKDCRAFTVDDKSLNKPIFCDFNPYE